MHFGLTVSGGFCLCSTSMAQGFVNFTLFIVEETEDILMNSKEICLNQKSPVVSVQYLLHLMPRYVSLFSSTISFASFTLWQWISYQLITIKKILGTE